MNLSELRARLSAIADEQAAIYAEPGDTLTPEQEARFDALTTEGADVRARIEKAEARGAQVNLIRAAVAAGQIESGDAAATFEARNVNVNKPRDPFDLDTLRYGAPIGELRARAKTAIEATKWADDAALQEATRKVEQVRDPRGVVPGLILRTGNPDYVSAFEKGLAGQQATWSDAERKAVAAVSEFRAAMSLTDANGGYAIPFPIDPSIVLTNDGAANPVRRLARVESIVTNSWQGISSAGVTASFDAENAEVSDDSPTFAQPTVDTRMARAFVQGSIEISGDFANLANELTVAFADARDRLESTMFWSGASGSSQPIGIETALNGGSSEVAQASGEVFAVADIYNTQQALPPRYRAGRVAWTAELSTINAMRQFATANNYHGFLTDLSGGEPPTLLGYPLHEWSSMDAYSDVDVAATAVNHLLLIGDWRNYLIADRIGGTVEFIPHLFNTSNNLPSFTRGWVYYWRVGADSINDAGFRLLTLTTAA